MRELWWLNAILLFATAAFFLSLIGLVPHSWGQHPQVFDRAFLLAGITVAFARTARTRVFRGKLRKFLLCASPFKRSEKGGVAVIFCLSLPLLIMLAAGGIELQYVNMDRRSTQDVADRASLMGAKELSINAPGADNQAQAFALAQLTNVSQRSTVTVAVTNPTPSTVRVAVDTHRASFFLNILPAGGFYTHSVSTASVVNTLPLCVLIFGDANKNNIHLQNSSVMQAASCLVHSNQDVQVDNTASLSAADVEAGGKATGPITPAANVNAPAISDPFADVNITFPSGCATAPAGPGPGGGKGAGAANTLTIDGNTLYGMPYILSPKLYCQNIDVINGAKVKLHGGEYFFGGNLTLEDTSSITGDDVALQFADNVSFDFQGDSSVSLTGRKTGQYAGFVILTTRQNQANFIIESDHVSQLLGTIYVPNAQLQVLGTGQVAQASAWTVITAMSLQVQAAKAVPGSPAPVKGAGPSSPLLVINANYSASDVPVPKGVGPGSGGAQLVN